jgi:hypothetical protein
MASRSGNFGDASSSARGSSVGFDSSGPTSSTPVPQPNPSLVGQGNLPDLDTPTLSVANPTTGQHFHPTTGAALPFEPRTWPKNVFHSEDEVGQQKAKIAQNRADIEQKKTQDVSDFAEGFKRIIPRDHGSYVARYGDTPENRSIQDRYEAKRAAALKLRDESVSRYEADWQPPGSGVRSPIDTSPESPEATAKRAAQTESRSRMAEFASQSDLARQERAGERGRIWAAKQERRADLLKEQGKEDTSVRAVAAPNRTELISPVIDSSDAYYHSNGVAVHPITHMPLPLDRSHPDWQGLKSHIEPKENTNVTATVPSTGQPMELFKRHPRTGKPALPHDEFDINNSPIMLTPEQRAENTAARPSMLAATTAWSKAQIQAATTQNTFTSANDQDRAEIRKATPTVLQRIKADNAPDAGGIESTLTTHSTALSAANEMASHIRGTVLNNPQLGETNPDVAQHLRIQLGRLSEVSSGLDQVKRYVSSEHHPEVADDDGKVRSGLEIAEVGRGNLVGHIKTLRDIHKNLNLYEVMNAGSPRIGPVQGADTRDQALADAETIAADTHKKRKFNRKGAASTTQRNLGSEPVYWTSPEGEKVDISSFDVSNPTVRARATQIKQDIEAGKLTGINEDVLRGFMKNYRTMRLREREKAVEGGDVNAAEYRTEEGTAPNARRATTTRITAGVPVAAMGREGGAPTRPNGRTTSENKDTTVPVPEETPKAPMASELTEEQKAAARAPGLARVQTEREARMARKAPTSDNPLEAATPLFEPEPSSIKKPRSVQPNPGKGKKNSSAVSRQDLQATMAGAITPEEAAPAADTTSRRQTPTSAEALAALSTPRRGKKKGKK